VTQEHSSDSRKSRARERHERRKARGQGGMAQPSGASLPRPRASRRAPRQLQPAGGFKLPEIRLPYARLIVYAVGGAVFLLLVIFTLGRLSNNSQPASPNAIWLGTQWTYDQPSDDAVSALAARLRDHQISVAYAWVSLLQPNGAWSDTLRLGDVQAFAAQFKAAYPDARLYGWLSVAAQDEDGLNRLADAGIQQQITDFSRRVTSELGFDGVMLNIVPVLDGDEGFLSLLRRIRVVLGDAAVLAVAVPPDWTPDDPSVPQPPQIAPGTIWRDEYKQRVALLADQMVVMAFNSGLADPEDYTAWVAYQTQVFMQAVTALETNTQVLIGIPSYDTRSPEHDPAVESMAAAAAGIKRAASATEAASLLRGVAIYAEWDTDDGDWDIFRRAWLNR
jgi:hypothetical protein